MKRVIMFIPLLALLFVACNGDEKIDMPNLTVSVADESIVEIADGAIVCKKGEPVKFKFSGSADLVTFYSGKKGQSYANRNGGAVMDGDVSLIFNWKIANGSQFNCLTVFVSTTFGGLTGDALIDMEKLTNFDTYFTDVTNLFPIPTNKTDNSMVTWGPMNLNQYKGGRFWLAFRYKTPEAPGSTTYTLSNMAVSCAFEGENYTIADTKMDWKAFDMLATDSPYLMTGDKDSDGGRRWRTTSTAIVAGTSTNAGVSDLDWIVSPALNLTPSMPADVGEPIKGIADLALSEYRCTYDQAGEYIATFVVTNSAYENTKHTVRHIKIKIID